MCVGCRRVAAVDELIRVVASGGGKLSLGRHLPGRGAWLCAGSAGCVDLVVRRKTLARALRTELATEAVGGLQAMLAGHGSIEDSQIEPGSSRGTHRPVAGEQT